jgi:putative membrane protein
MSKLHAIKGSVVATAIAGLTALTLQAQQGYTAGSVNQTGTSSDKAAAKFIKEAAWDNENEINLGQAGAQKAENADLKSYCEMVQKDHTQANNDLQPLAQKYGVTMETTHSSEREANKFEKETTGAKLDQKLATEFLKDHQKAIAQFEKASTQVMESDVKAYIDKELPKLRDHFQHAETVARAVGVSESTISSYSRKAAAVGGTADEPGIQHGTGSQDQNAPPSTSKP